MNQFEHIDPSRWVFIQYRENRASDGLYIILEKEWNDLKGGNISRTKSYNPEYITETGLGMDNSMTISSGIDCYHWSELPEYLKSRLKSKNKNLYSHFEEYFKNIVTVEIAISGYTYYRFKDKLYPALRVPESYFAGELIPQEVRIFHSQYVKAQKGSDFDIDKKPYKTVVIEDMQYLSQNKECGCSILVACNCNPRTKSEQERMVAAYRGRIKSSDFEKIVDPYGTGHKTNNSPNNTNTNEQFKLPTKIRSLPGGKRLTSSIIQSTSGKNPTTTGYPVRGRTVVPGRKPVRER